MTTLDEADAVWARYPELPRTYIDARVAAVILKLEARLAAAERVVAATRSFPNALMMDALEAYDALGPEGGRGAPISPQPTRWGPEGTPCGIVHAPHNFGRCARCNTVLNNLTTGILTVKGGARICAACLRPDEEVIARVRGRG